MGLLYDLKQKEYDDGEREFIEQSKPYIEFLDLLQSISDFTKDTPHTVAKFLYEDKEIFTLTSYDLEFEPQENTGYYEYDEKLDDYTKIIVSYSEWFFRTFLDFDNIKEFQDVLDLFGYCFFKKTDILTLDCLKKIGFVDISLLEEIDEIERLTRENIEQKKIIEKLSNALSLKTNATETTTLQNQLDQAQAYIAELENQSGNKELPTRTANNASKIILAMAECLGWDLSKPFADETNGKIREILEKQGNALSKDTVGKWLKQAYDIGK